MTVNEYNKGASYRKGKSLSRHGLWSSSKNWKEKINDPETQGSLIRHKLHETEEVRTIEIGPRLYVVARRLYHVLGRSTKYEV